MDQVDFSKIDAMNINSDVIFANQGSTNNHIFLYHNDKTAEMITTTTRGVGNNRNIALIYANADICLFADDDIFYVNNLEQIVLEEFAKIPKAEAIIFNVDSNSDNRPQYKNSKIKRFRFYSKNPYGTIRIAIKLDSLRKKNIWFSTLFGGGCKFSCGEDTLFINDLRRKKIRIYLSDKNIGTIDQNFSTWYTGSDEQYFYSRGALYRANYHLSIFVLMHIIYFAMRMKFCKIKILQRIKLMYKGSKGFNKGMSYSDWISHHTY
jgi:glycosyltransferase involved in cell wall biosynthesis